jgi:hypothetical protein
VSPNRIYRFTIWLPLIVPILVIAAMNILLKGLGMPKPSGYLDISLEVLAYSAIYGGLPYLLLAIWATRWVRGREEPEIRRVMLVAPLLMVVVFGVACLIMGAIGNRMDTWIRIAGRGATIIIPLGYTYVVMAMALRRWLGPPRVEGISAGSRRPA